MNDLKRSAIRGGFAKVCSQGAGFAVRIGTLMILGRLLDPKDFGIVGMVTAVIGVLNLFKDFGLSTASIQRVTITEQQLSTLFWINMIVGATLSVLSVASAPVLVGFYREPRLLAIASALALSFLINAAGVQHNAILQRQMRFTVLAVIEFLALIVSSSVGIGMALAGFGYWSLVGMGMLAPAVSTIGSWAVAAWLPKRPQSWSGVRDMMRFGGTVTLNSLIMYLAYNIEKVLIGRYWGADAIGLYGRCYQLINIPTENLNSSIGGVAFSALSRIQNDSQRFKSYFLKSYGLLLALTVPVAAVGALFAEDLILVLLGPKWKDAAFIFRLLSPTMLVLALINPLSWLLFSQGLVRRSLKIALVLALLVMTGYVIGLPHGPAGVATAYSATMVLWVIPHIACCVRGTVVSLRDILITLSRPLLSSAVGVAVSWSVASFISDNWAALPRLVVGAGVLFAVYSFMLMYIMGQKPLFMELLCSLSGRRSADGREAVISV
jgi:PST family polysaccharide transporter